MGALSLPILFATDRSFASLVEIFAGAAHPRRAARFSRHLLLLPQSLLPRVFSRSAGLCRGGTCQTKISGRDEVSFHSPKSTPLFFLCGGGIHSFSLARRYQGLQFWRPLRHRRRHARSDHERHLAHALHVFLPLVATPCWRQARLFLL